MKDVKVLHTPECPYYKRLEKMLDSLRIRYEDIDISKNQGILRKFPALSSPTLIVNNRVVLSGQNLPGEKELKKLIWKS